MVKSPAANIGECSAQDRTRDHYDRHPFDAITREDERQPRNIQPTAFINFCERYLRFHASVAEIGCGPGRGTIYLAAIGAHITAVDISAVSLMRARKRAPSAGFARATALALPFRDNDFEAVVCDGVIHHTPDPHAAFRECVRVLRPGVYFYLGVYKRQRYYYYLYTFVGPPIRWLSQSAVGRIILSLTLIPIYYLAHLAKSRGKRTWEGATNYFYDYFVTPHATFYTREQIAAWGEELGLDLVEYDPSPGNVHAFVFWKPTE